MPRGDGTGPLGEGPMTGRAAGYCAGYSAPGFTNPVPGRGFWGRGGRRRFHWYWRTGYPGYYVPPVSPVPPAPVPYRMEPKDKVKYLENVAADLKKELEAIEKRINELRTE